MEKNLQIMMVITMPDHDHDLPGMRSGEDVGGESDDGRGKRVSCGRCPHQRAK